MFNTLFCWLWGARVIKRPPQVQTAIEKLKKAGFEIPAFQIARKTMEENISAQIATNRQHTCIMLNDNWFESSEEQKVHVLVHELLHACDQNIVDIAYAHDPMYDKLTIAQHLHNADSIAELVDTDSLFRTITYY